MYHGQLARLGPLEDALNVKSRAARDTSDIRASLVTWMGRPSRWRPASLITGWSGCRQHLPRQADLLSRSVEHATAIGANREPRSARAIATVSRSILKSASKTSPRAPGTSAAGVVGSRDFDRARSRSSMTRQKRLADSR
jgi:hypothetical protein